MIYNIQTLLSSTNNLVGKLQIGYFEEVRRVGENKTQAVAHRAHYIELYGEIRFTNICDNNKPKLTKNLLSSDSSGDEKKSPVCIRTFLDISGDFEWRINKIMNKYCELLPRENIYNRERSRVDNYEFTAVTINCECSAKWIRYSLSSSRYLNIKKAILIGVGTYLITMSLSRPSTAGLLRYQAFKIYDSLRNF